MSAPPSRLLLRDAVALGTLGLRGRPLRAALSALGIALGVAAVVGVLGLSASSTAGLLRQIDALGTDLLRVQAGTTLFGETSRLPAHAAGGVARLPGVRTVGWTADLEPKVYRSPAVPRTDTAGLTLRAAGPDLPAAVSARMAAGRWLDGALAAQPAVVLGWTAAQRLGISTPSGQLLDLGGTSATVVGILAPAALAPELDTSVLVGEGAARALGWDGRPTTLYERSGDDDVGRVRDLLPAAANPEHPEEVRVSRPSDALVAKASARSALTGLFLALGAVALLVGGVGVANVMVIGVLERRGEIGLRRALGARRGHVAAQFALEALVLSVLGGLAGAVLGVLTTVVASRLQGWEPVVPASALLAAGAASVLVGAVAGLHPAVRAARLPPTAALAAL